MEELKSVYECFRGLPVVIISISVDPDDSPEELAEYRASLSAEWRFARDPDIGLAYRIRAIPTVVIVDGEGRIRFRREGLISSSVLIDMISELLNELEE